MIIKTKYDKAVVLIILITALIRAFIAQNIQFGNDEVYYWTYALYPSLSHFDHPPMLGWIIQIFTLNLSIDSELFIRLGSIVLGMASTWVLYLITKMLKSDKAGLFAVLLFISSIYCTVIAGIFILPDAPQTFFWLLSVYFFIQVISKDKEFNVQKKYLVYAGLTIGLAILSKYTSIYLWGGFGLYVLFCDRKWLKTKILYVSVLLTMIISLPILIWNLQNEFISFTFHGARIDATDSSLQIDTFLRELGGQFLYNNPIVVVLIVISLIAVIRKRLYIQTEYQHLLLFLSLPLIFTFLGISLFRATLPHWTGPAYMTLLIFPAVYLVQKFADSKFPWPLKLSTLLLFSILVMGVGQINYGLFTLDQHTEIKRWGKSDFSLDMYGWDQVKDGFKEIIDNDDSEAKNAIIVQRWFPAAHLDYYVAQPLEVNLYALGKLERIHKYAWINQDRGGFKQGMSAYYITMSNDFNDPSDVYADKFEHIGLVKNIPIIRNNKVVKYALVYKLKGLKQIPVSIIE